LGGLSLTVVHIGKPKEPFIHSGIEHYRKRISCHASLFLQNLKAVPLRKGISIGEVQQKEKERILRVLDERQIRVFLDEKGKSFRSSDLAQWLGTHAQQGRSQFLFVVGGPVGISPELLQDAHMLLSLSPMTLSHDLTLLVLLEQIYRALAILHNLPYPK
jgi:23S rRNA (pseudouridine1915-N3)-methyltransferase